MDLIGEGDVDRASLNSGGILGTSALTEPIQFTVGDKYVVAAASVNDSLSRKGLLVGIVLVCVVLATLLIGLAWFLRNRKVLILTIILQRN